jgi:hypothetical protein
MRLPLPCSLIFLFGAAIGISGQYNSAISTLVIDFKRQYVQNDRKELVEGTIFYHNGVRTVVRVIAPVQQWMVLDGDTMILYYPESKTAFRITHSNPFYLPFLQTMLGAASTDFGLEKLDFRIERNENHNDTVHYYWKAPRRLKKAISAAHVTYTRGKLLNVEFLGKKGALMIATKCWNHYEWKGLNIPLELSIRINQTRAQITEEVHFGVPSINTALPGDITSFKIPFGVEIKEVEL